MMCPVFGRHKRRATYSVIVVIFPSFFYDIFFFVTIVVMCDPEHDVETIHGVHGVYEPRYEKTGFLHMRKQRRRSASR